MADDSERISSIIGGNPSAPNGTGGGSDFERRCENSDCYVNELVSLVPKRKITEFVTEPRIMDKPLLINGDATVFQVEGTSASLSDLKNPTPEAANQPKTIFRVVPNTHAHIVNYVVVDDESLRKINANDPEAMRKLLNSQKVCADNMLQKLMAGHDSSVPNSSTATSFSPTLPGQKEQIGSPADTAVNPISTNSIGAAMINKANRRHNPTPMTSAANVGGTIINPTGMHPNVRITAVGSLTGAGGPLPTDPSVPTTTPVPLANLQKTSIQKNCGKQSLN